ncbi:MAG: class I SAM-dependent methyltransferase [Patescibacteria group bacterium]|nr:class I SAM-dependent methyltransferase [Patescibacteria group bacterium]
MKTTKQYVEGRDWEKYRMANANFPNARKIEVGVMVDLIDPQLGQKILEAGTGNGVITVPLANAVGKDGTVVTYDATKENTVAIQEKDLPNVTAKVQALEYNLDEKDGEVDTVVSLAAFHHYDSNIKDSGGTGFAGRLRALKEFARVLKPGGKVVIGDIATNTGSARYFDSIDTPELCPGGHPHDFLNKNLVDKLCQQAGLMVKEFTIKKVPWTFNGVNEAQTFINTIHGSLCSEEESLEHAKKYLKFWKQDDKYHLEWWLFYLVAEKK